MCQEKSKQKGLMKATTKKCENKNLTYILFQYNFQKCMVREGLTYAGSEYLKINTITSIQSAFTYSKSTLKIPGQSLKLKFKIKTLTLNRFHKLY